VEFEVNKRIKFPFLSFRLNFLWGVANSVKTHNTLIMIRFLISSNFKMLKINNNTNVRINDSCNFSLLHRQRYLRMCYNDMD